MEVTQGLSRSKEYPRTITHFYQKGNRFYFESANSKLEVWVVNDKIFRFRFTPEHFSRDFSYAINEPLEESSQVLQCFEIGNDVEIHTAALICKIKKDSKRIVFETLKGKIINEDDTGYHWEPNSGFGGQYVYCSKKIQPQECFFGLGDKACDLNLRGKRFLNWGTDTYGFAREQDPLYRNIPFYYGLHHGMGYGIFFDNSFQTYFDFGHESFDVTSFWAEGGEMCYYFIYGPELISVAEQYTHVTGVPELPPMWALGYQQSKWSYYPEAKVRELADEFRKRNIPCDVIHLDIDYMDGFRCFTWDKSRFPDPPGMLADLKAKGFKTILIIDPGIKIDPDYEVFKTAFEKGYFCKRQDGDLMRGKVWPGECNFPDFTNPEVRQWWSTLFKELADQGVAGIWNDMNEPSVFEMGTFPDDVRHNYDGCDVSHRRGHNVYGMQMARATYNGMKTYNSKNRPFVLTRSGFSGVQRYSAVWTGDNVASWEHLWIANIQCQRLAISGISFCGTDIGGFIGDPDGELFVRYIQMAIFHPFFRGHSSSDQGDKEPWAFGEAYESLIKKAIELRYQLLPYIYSTFWQYVTKGTPMIRPLSFISQNEQQAIYRQEEFGFGDQLIVCPIGERTATGRWMFLPKGTWYNYWTGTLMKGGSEIWVEGTLDRFPLFVKAGAVIPHYPVMQFTGEKKFETLVLQTYFSINRNCSVMYEDAGEGYGYKNGEASVKKFTTFGNKHEMRILQNESGSFSVCYNDYKLIICGLPFRPREYEVDGVSIKLPGKFKERNLIISVNKNFKKIRIF